MRSAFEEVDKYPRKHCRARLKSPPPPVVLQCSNLEGFPKEVELSPYDGIFNQGFLCNMKTISGESSLGMLAISYFSVSPGHLKIEISLIFFSNFKYMSLLMVFEI